MTLLAEQDSAYTAMLKVVEDSLYETPNAWMVYGWSIRHDCPVCYDFLSGEAAAAACAARVPGSAVAGVFIAGEDSAARTTKAMRRVSAAASPASSPATTATSSPATTAASTAVGGTTGEASTGEAVKICRPVYIGYTPALVYRFSPDGAAPDTIVPLRDACLVALSTSFARVREAGDALERRGRLGGELGDLEVDTMWGREPVVCAAQQPVSLGFLARNYPSMHLSLYGAEAFEEASAKIALEGTIYV